MCGLLGGVLWIIVLLKILLTHHCLQFFKTFHHPITQNLTILVSIHLSFNLYKHPHIIPTHTPPYHKIILPLYCCWCRAIWNEFDSFFPYIHHPIWSNLYLTTRLFSSHLLSSFHAVEQSPGASDNESSLTWVFFSLWQTKNHSSKVSLWPFWDGQGVEGWIDEMGSLNSNIQPSWLNLMTGECFIMNRKLGRTFTKIFFLICIYHFLDSSHSRLPDISSLLNISNRISLFKQKYDKSTDGSRKGSCSGGKRLS